MATLERLMEVVSEVVSAYSQIWTAQSNGATWDEFSDDRKHYACKLSALEDMLRTLVEDRTRLEYEATMLMTAMTDVVAHFTKTPSTLADSEARGAAHAANARMRQVLLEMTGSTGYAVNKGTPCRDDGRCQYAIGSGAEGMGACPVGKCIKATNGKTVAPLTAPGR